jgi:MoxR-like ATPase
MFSLWLDYPAFDEEITIVRNTTSSLEVKLESVISKQEILDFQKLIRKMPINDNVLKYAVTLVAKTRPNTELAPEISNKFLKWGAGPRASQYLVVGAKTHAALHGKYSPDIDDVKAVAVSILRHRIIKNYKAEAENISVEQIIEKLL